MKYIILAGIPILLAGCNLEVYRYACQNPDNWETAECQKPQCEVSRTCPEHIFKSETVVKAATSVPKPVAQSLKGECK
jgi:hypothetical protein